MASTSGDSGGEGLLFPHPLSPYPSPLGTFSEGLSPRPGLLVLSSSHFLFPPSPACQSPGIWTCVLELPQGNAPQAQRGRSLALSLSPPGQRTCTEAEMPPAPPPPPGEGPTHLHTGRNPIRPRSALPIMLSHNPLGKGAGDPWAGGGLVTCTRSSRVARRTGAAATSAPDHRQWRPAAWPGDGGPHCWETTGNWVWVCW